MSTIEQFAIATPNGLADTPSAALCRVCQRAKTRMQPDHAGRILACDLCLHIDAAVAALHGARLLTPLNRHDHAPDEVLYHRLFDVDSTGTRTARFQEFHAAALITMNDMAVAEGTRHLVVTYPYGPRYALFVDWQRWQERFPASLGASIRSYELYLTRVHPWALAVEPRLLEPEWLTGLLGGGARRGR